MAKAPKQLQFPLGGVNRHTAIQRQPPFSTPDCLNVMPYDALELRGRGGSRPGLGSACAKQMHTAGGALNTNPVSLLFEYRGDANQWTNFSYWGDNFDHGNTERSSQWRALTDGAGTVPTLLWEYGGGPSHNERGKFLYNSSATLVGYTIDPIDGIDRTRGYSQGILCSTPASEYNNQFCLFFRLSGTHVDPFVAGQSGIMCVVNPNFGDPAKQFGGVYEFNNGSLVNSSTDNSLSADTNPDAGWMAARLDPDTGTYGTIYLYWNGVLILTHTISSTLSADGYLGGFGMKAFNGTTESRVHEYFLSGSQFTSNDPFLTPQRRSTKLCASNDGNIHAEYEGDMQMALIDMYGTPGVENGISATLADEGPMQAAQWDDSVYIADNSNAPLFKTDASLMRIIDDTTATIKVAIDTDTYQGTPPASWGREVRESYVVVHEAFPNFGLVIASAALDIGLLWDITVKGDFSGYDPGTELGTNQSLNVWVVRAVKRFRYYQNAGYLINIHGRWVPPAGGGASTWDRLPDSAGIAPCMCHSVAVFRRRLVLCNPSLCFMSKIDYPNNWDYFPSADDDAGIANAQFFVIGDGQQDCRAMVAYQNDYLAFLCSRGVWVLRGDPAYDAEQDVISKSVGIVGQQAWTIGEGGALYFMGSDNLYRVAPAEGTSLQALGAYDELPDELRSRGGQFNGSILAYDPKHFGLWVILRRFTGDDIGTRHYWFDLGQRKWWPLKISANVKITCTLLASGDHPWRKRLLFGTESGKILTPDMVYRTDDDNTFDSYVDIGPFLLGQTAAHDGVLTRMDAVLAGISGDVDWTLYAEDTPEGAVYADTARATGTWTAGRNYTDYPRVRGNAARLRLENNGLAHWAFESLTAEISPKGYTRKEA